MPALLAFAFALVAVVHHARGDVLGMSGTVFRGEQIQAYPLKKKVSESNQIKTHSKQNDEPCAYDESKYAQVFKEIDIKRDGLISKKEAEILSVNTPTFCCWGRKLADKLDSYWQYLKQYGFESDTTTTPKPRVKQSELYRANGVLNNLFQDGNREWVTLCEFSTAMYHSEQSSEKHHSVSHQRPSFRFVGGQHKPNKLPGRHQPHNVNPNNIVVVHG